LSESIFMVSLGDPSCFAGALGVCGG